MRIFVNNYVKGCAHCQQFKINQQPVKPLLNPVDRPKSTRPFSQTSMDFIVDLPPINGYDSIMSVVDHGLSKGVILIPCNKKNHFRPICTIIIGQFIQMIQFTR